MKPTCEHGRTIYCPACEQMDEDRIQQAKAWVKAHPTFTAVLPLSHGEYLRYLSHSEYLRHRAQMLAQTSAVPPEALRDQLMSGMGNACAAPWGMTDCRAQEPSAPEPESEPASGPTPDSSGFEGFGGGDSGGGGASDDWS